MAAPLATMIQNAMQTDSRYPGALTSESDNHAFPENFHPVTWKSPRPADRYNLVVLSGGYGGSLTALEAVRAGAKVAVVERNLPGGVCLNSGCIPSKVLLRTARLYAEMKNGGNYGATMPRAVDIDFAAAMKHMRRVRARISRRRSASELRLNGIDVFFGEGRFTGPDAVTVNGATLRFRRALIATGAHPFIPQIPGPSEAGYLTNETVFELTERPRSFLVIGGGPLGCELAQAFCRLGSRVSIVQDEPLFLSQEERDAAQILSDSLARDGIDIHLNTQITWVRTKGVRKQVELVNDDSRSIFGVDTILVGAGRAPNVQGMNLKAAGVKYDDLNGIRINDFLQMSNPAIYGAGDVCLEHKFAHIEGASAHFVTQNALFFGRQRLSELTVPWCTYTDPEIAHVGMYVKEAREKNIAGKTITVPMHEVDRAIIDGEDEGFVKIHVKEGTDRILGATVVASHAGEMISDISLAIAAGIGLRRLARASHPYPTQAAAIKLAATTCCRANRSRSLAWCSRKWMKWQTL